jgi:hypothetical protein
MHTLKIVGLGFLLLGLCLLVGRAISRVRGIAMAALMFLPLWLLGSAFNLYIGVRHAGYSLREEMPVFAIVFLIPAVVAGLLWWKQ